MKGGYDQLKSRCDFYSKLGYYEGVAEELGGGELPLAVNETLVPYSGYFSGGKIFMSSEFLASLWKNVCGHGILNHTLVLCGTIS